MFDTEPVFRPLVNLPATMATVPKMEQGMGFAQFSLFSFSLYGGIRSLADCLRRAPHRRAIGSICGELLNIRYLECSMGGTPVSPLA